MTRYVKVKFEDNRSFIYKTDDVKIGVGSKVRVDGKRAGAVGEVIEAGCAFKSRGGDAYPVTEVISYGSMEPTTADKGSDSKLREFKVYYSRIRIENNDRSVKKLRPGDLVIIRLRPFRLVLSAIEVCNSDGDCLGFITAQKDRDRKIFQSLQHNLGLKASVKRKTSKLLVIEMDPKQEPFELASSQKATGNLRLIGKGEKEAVRGNCRRYESLSISSLSLTDVKVVADNVTYPGWLDNARLGDEFRIETYYEEEAFASPDDYKYTMPGALMGIKILSASSQTLVTETMTDYGFVARAQGATTYTAVLTGFSMEHDLTYRPSFTVYAFRSNAGKGSIGCSAGRLVNIREYGLVMSDFSVVIPCMYQVIIPYRGLLFCERDADYVYDVYDENEAKRVVAMRIASGGPSGKEPEKLRPIYEGISANVTYKWGSVYWAALERNNKLALICDETRLERNSSTDDHVDLPLGLDFIYDRIEGLGTLGSSDPLDNKYFTAVRDGKTVYVNRRTGLEEEPVLDGTNEQLWQRMLVRQVENLGSRLNSMVSELNREQNKVERRSNMTISDMIEELTQYFEAAGFADFYETQLKGKTDMEIRELHAATFGKADSADSTR